MPKPTPPRTPLQDRTSRLGLRPMLGLALLALALDAGTGSAGGESNPAGATVSFRHDIAPVLVERCLRCHGDDVVKGGYRVDSFARVMEAGDTGKPAIAAGAPESSHLFELLVTDDEDDRMPQKGEPLDDATIALFRQWIQEGAAFDGPDPAEPLARYAGVGAFPQPPLRYAFPVPIPAVAFLPGDRLAVGGFREITIWTSDGVLARRLTDVPERLQTLMVRPAEGVVFFAGGSPGRSGAAGVVSLEGTGAPRIFLRSRDTLLALACSPDGSRLAVGGTDREIVVFDGRTLERLRTLSGHSDWILDLAFSADGRHLATASRDRTARVFNVIDGSMVCAFRDHKDAVTAVAFVDGTNRVVTASKEGRLRLWNATTGKDARASEAVMAEATRLEVLDDSILSIWSDGKIREYRSDNLKAIHAWGSGEERLLGLAMAPGLETFATTRQDGAVQLWQRTTRHLDRTFVASP